MRKGERRGKEAQERRRRDTGWEGEGGEYEVKRRQNEGGEEEGKGDTNRRGKERPEEGI